METPKPGGYEARLSRRAEGHRTAREKFEEEYKLEQKEEDPEVAAFVEYLVSTIQTKELKNVFVEYLEKSGVPAERANTGFLDRILFVPMPGTNAAYSAIMNRMYLSTRGNTFVQALQLHKEGRPIPDDMLMDLQHSFIHEATHGFSRIRLEPITEVSNARTVMREDVGYSMQAKYVHKSGRPEKMGHIKVAQSLYEALNEGVTERIAEEISLEYAKRVGSSQAALQHMLSRGDHIAQNERLYVRYAAQVDAICERIAAYVGLPNEVVWNGFKRGYFEDPQWFVGETVMLFNETFGEDFIKDYAYLDGDVGERLRKEFDQKYQLNVDPQKIRREWLQHLGISPEATSANA